jgi:hypothetical protein
MLVPGISAWYDTKKQLPLDQERVLVYSSHFAKYLLGPLTCFQFGKYIHRLKEWHIEISNGAWRVEYWARLLINSTSMTTEDVKVLNQFSQLGVKVKR